MSEIMIRNKHNTEKNVLSIFFLIDMYLISGICLYIQYHQLHPGKGFYRIYEVEYQRYKSVAIIWHMTDFYHTKDAWFINGYLSRLL